MLLGCLGVLVKIVRNTVREKVMVIGTRTYIAAQGQHQVLLVQWKKTVEKLVPSPIFAITGVIFEML